MNKNAIYLNNTLSGKKELFEPIKNDEVKIYVCGITPYDYAHIGHGRVYVTFDILYRLLKFLNYKVKYCRNFTDIDDKLLNKAQKEFDNQFSYHIIADRYIHAFHEDMKSLNCLTPDVEPHVTKVIPEIIEFIKKLIDLNKAYQIDGDVYFAVKSFPEYGKLSKRNIEDLKVGARIEIDKRKKDPLDFALWKSENEGNFWKSPWGWGRPGWHIECSVMAEKFLSKQIDIHAGGMDLIFPHHENEIAQSEGLHNETFAKYWLHNAFVRIDKEKMSKSLGNFFTLKDVFKKFDPMVLRYYYVNHNYNIPLDFSFEELEKTEKNYKKLCRIFENVQTSNISDDEMKKSEIVQKMLTVLCNDLNTAGMLGVLFENVKEIENNKSEAEKAKAFLQKVIGSYIFFDKKNNNFIGRAGLRNENVDGNNEVVLNYALMPEYWNKGLATEMAQAIIKIAFENLKIKSLVTFTDPSNEASIKVMKKSGFEFEKTFKYAHLNPVLYRLTEKK